MRARARSHAGGVAVASTDQAPSHASTQATAGRMNMPATKAGTSLRISQATGDGDRRDVSDRSGARRASPRPLLPVVYVSPPRPLGILRVVVTDNCPLYGVDNGIPIAIQIGAPLKPAHRAPFLTLVGALAVQAPQIIRSLGLDKNEIAMRSFHSLLTLRQSPPVETAVLNGLAHVLRL